MPTHEKCPVCNSKDISEKKQNNGIKSKAGFFEWVEYEYCNFCGTMLVPKTMMKIERKN